MPTITWRQQGNRVIARGPIVWSPSRATSNLQQETRSTDIRGDAITTKKTQREVEEETKPKRHKSVVANYYELEPTDNDQAAVNDLVTQARKSRELVNQDLRARQGFKLHFVQTIHVREFTDVVDRVHQALNALDNSAKVQGYVGVVREAI